ncbi:MAG: glycosyl transferase family 90 [Rickettsiaceae bacterium]|nr:glycosyl transferase family 90 [Rickettsiaceae bacterium]
MKITKNINLILLVCITSIALNIFLLAKLYRHKINQIYNTSKAIASLQLTENYKLAEELVKINLTDCKANVDLSEFQALKDDIMTRKITSAALIIIKNHKIYAFSGVEEQRFRLQTIVANLKEINSILKDNVFLFVYHDTLKKSDPDYKILTSKYQSIPVFCFAINDALKKEMPGKFILFPDDYTLGKHSSGYWSGWRNFYNEIKKSKAKYPWESKEDKIIWQGKLSDCSWPDCQNSPRLNLVQMGDKYDFIFAKFASLIKSDIEEYKSMGLGRYWVNFVNINDQTHYKYLMTMDGVTCTYPGFLTRLYSNSVTLKQESDEIQWFYPILKPGEHYVQVKKDLSDLPEKYYWLQSNQDKAQQISQNAQEIVEKYINPDHILYGYIPRLLNEYSRFISFDVGKLL